MIRATCHCGAIELVAPAPTEVTDCNCSICRRYGVLWAYYEPKDVELAGTGRTDIYMWDDRSIAFHRCATCGCVCCWMAVDPERKRMGINARLMDLSVLGAVRVRRLDGAGTEEYID